MAGKGRSIGLVVVLVAIGAVLVGATLLAFRLVRQDRPGLCPGTPKLLASLHGPVVVDAYVTRGAPKLDHFVGELDALLHEYERQSQGHFHYRILEAKDEDTRKRAKDLGLTEQPYAEGDDAGASLVQGFMGLAFEYAGERDSIKYLPPDSTQGLEFWIDNKLRELRAKAESRSYHFGVLGMHGEIALSEANLVPRAGGTPNLQGIITQNFPFYAFHDIDLMGGTGDVDPSVDALIVTQPSKDLTDGELTRIDEYLMRGKAVAFFVSAVNVAAGDGSMQATLATHGLEKLLAGYGIELRRDVVIDPRSSASFPVSTVSGLAHMSLPFVPLARDQGGSGERTLDSSFPAFFRLTELSFPMASSVVLHRDRQPEATLHELAWSSALAVRITGATVDLHPLRPWTPTGAEGKVALAAAVEGTLHGAFDESRRSTGHARVLLVASSQFLANPLARAGNPGAEGTPPGDEQLLQLAGPYAQQEMTSTILAFKNTLDWLSGDDDLVDCSLLRDAGR